MKILNWVVVLITVVSGLMNCIIRGDTSFWILFTFLFIMNFTLGLLLVIAAIRIRKVVKQTVFAHPNERLVIIHSINFSVW